MPTVHERDEWLDGYQVAANEGSAWWGGNTWPGDKSITNLTWHYPGGNVTLTEQGQYAAELRNEQAAYHRRRDGGSNGRPSPFDQGYDLGYNAMIDPAGDVWKVRWTDKQCAANGSSASNRQSFAVQFMVAHLNDDLTEAQVEAARWLDHYLRNLFPNIPTGVAGHKGHRDWYATACPGDVIYRNHVTNGDLLWRDIPDPPPPPPEEDMPYTLFPCSDADAVFYGPFDGKQIQVIEWLSSEDVAHYRADKVPEFQANHSSFRRGTLISEVPTGDSRYQWSKADFKRVVTGGSGGPGPKGDKGDPGPAPHGTFAISGGSVTL